jgi:thiol-disulfide isomerase/thioredoxin
MSKIVLISLIALSVFIAGCTQASGRSFEPLNEVTGEIVSFQKVEGEICTQNGKPIIRMYSTTWCQHCKWIRPTVKELFEYYTSTGDITAHIWEIDIGDDYLTFPVEAKVPETEMAIYNQFNPKGTIPTYVFGCKYYRIGNAFEQQNDLDSEVKDMQRVMKKLIEETST